MYKFYILIAITAPAASLNLTGWKGITGTPSNFVTSKDMKAAPMTPDILLMLSNLERDRSNSKCYRDFQIYFESLTNELWADKMFDSMEKIPYGLLYGRTVYIGSFDECVYADSGGFTGKHCMVDVILRSSSGNLVLTYGLCVPSSCTALDIKIALGDSFDMFFGNNVSIKAIDENCWTKDPITLSSEEWIVIGFLGFMGLIAICSTIFEIMHTKGLVKSNRNELYSSFSLYNNTRQLVKVYNGPGNIGCLHGIRSLTMCWIILCHEFVIGVFAPLLNGAAVMEDFMTSRYKIVINNGFVAVDTFFLLSGLLVTLVFFRNISKTKTYDVPVAMIHRFIRLTPAFAAMVLIQSIIIIKLGKGPLWYKVVGSGVEACKDSWWTGLLYIQNIVKPMSSCLGQSWYLSSDMQMFWLSPLLLFPLLLKRGKGLIFLILALLAALTTNFVVSFVYELGPHLFTSRSERQFDTDYVQTHMRLTPYIVGMAVGYIICGMKAKKFRVKLSKCQIVLGWLLSAGLCLGSMYGVVYFFDNDYRDNYILSSLYLTLHRLGWSLGLAWVIIVCTAGYGGPVDHILSWDGFQIIGKISYCMFLVHFSIQLARLGMMQTNFFAHDFFFVSNYLSTLFFSILFAVPLYLLFEAPFSNLDRYFLRNLKILPYRRNKCT